MITNFATTNVQEYIDSLGPNQSKVCKLLSGHPLFNKFLEDPNYNDPVGMCDFVTTCNEVAIPAQFTSSSSGLHYLAKAIKSHLG